jgi:hypothetical protein
MKKRFGKQGNVGLIILFVLLIAGVWLFGLNKI